MSLISKGNPVTICGLAKKTFTDDKGITTESYYIAFHGYFIDRYGNSFVGDVAGTHSTDKETYDFLCTKKLPCSGLGLISQNAKTRAYELLNFTC